MTSLHGFTRSSLLTITAFVSVASFAFGAQPPDVVTSDSAWNTAMGPGALNDLTFGSFNTAAGYFVLTRNTDGTDNTAFGSIALAFNTTGNSNTAVGSAALNNNTIGYDDTAVGAHALISNTTGNANAALGSNALLFNTTGLDNTAAGVYSLQSNTTGDYNTALGSTALWSNTTGSYNSGIGARALQTNEGGSNNIALGFYAGYYVRGGNYNIEIGNVGTANDVGTIRIGTASQQGTTYVAGIANSHVAGSAVYITAAGQLGVLASSERYKTDVASMGSSSEKVKALRPVTFHLKTDPKAGVQYGLIAEEVAKVYPELVIRGDKGQIEGVRYEELTPMLLNELQAQQRKAADQATQLREMQQQLSSMQAVLLNLQAKEGRPGEQLSR